MKSQLFAIAVSIAAAIIAAPAQAQDCGGWTTSDGRVMNMGDLCDGGATAATTAVPTPVTTRQTVTVCNETSEFINFAIAAGSGSNLEVQGSFLLTDSNYSEAERCQTVDIPRSDRGFYVRAWQIVGGNRLFTETKRSFCVSGDYWQVNSAANREDCDRTPGSNEWLPFGYYQMRRSGHRNIEINY